MKLKNRVVVMTFGMIAMVLLIAMTFSIVLYSDSYSSYDSFLPNIHGSSIKRNILENLDIGRALARKGRPSHSRPTTQLLNETADDSNRAAEVELSEKEYQDLLEKGEILSKPAKVLRPHPTAKAHQKEVEATKGGGFPQECSTPKTERDPDDPRDEFPELLKLLQEKEMSEKLWNTVARKTRITIQEVHEIELEKNVTRMEDFHLKISDIDLYDENDKTIDALLDSMATMPIVHVEEKTGGTQLKLLITFYDGSQAMLKPMRFDRDKETEPNHFYFVDYERHNSEIAAFHLDRILGFRRCPPVVGRRLNITTEIYAVADDELLKTFFISPAQNICFHGHCSYYCDTSHAICGRPDSLEGSLAAFLPPDTLSGRKSWKNPWRRTYHKRRRAEWEVNDAYCHLVRKQPNYPPKRLADIVDMAILDFLIGNMDRHHYETFKIFGNESFIIHLDHGRGFGKPKHDETSILAPLYQCCFLHITTFHRLLQLQLNPLKLSSLMRCSLYRDPLHPVLLDSHLQALDRRLETVLQVVQDCLRRRNKEEVFYHDTDLEDGKY